MAEGDDYRSLWLVLPEPLREVPADLAAVTVVVACACLSVLPGVNQTPLRVLFGLPFLLVAPGYALVAVLFPERATNSSDDTAASSQQSVIARTGSGLTSVERVALSFGLSIMIVPLVGLVLNFTPLGITLGPIVLGLSAVTLVLVALGTARRQALPEPERFRVSYRTWPAAARSALFAPRSRREGALNVLLVVSLLLALSSVGFALFAPSEDDSFSEFYLLTENEDGETVAAEYPETFELGESKPVIVGVGNNEGEPVRYSIVVQLQEVASSNNRTQVVRRVELDRFSTPTIQNNETWQRTYEIEPTITGADLRVQYLLYRDSVPAAPSRENAYRTLHLWIDVAE